MKSKKKERPEPESYRSRSYRRLVRPKGLVPFEVRVRETDLHILADRKLQEQAMHSVLECRSQLESYIAAHPRFLVSLVPLAIDPLAPPVVREMLAAGRAAGVGPMAAVAGAVAQFVGRRLLAEDDVFEVIVENGGDIFLSRREECLVGIFAGTSPLSDRVGIKIPPARMPLGVCTSSGRVGHSLSLGQSDSVTVLASSTPLADAAATRLGNEVGNRNDINDVLAVAREIKGIQGVVIIRDDQLGAWGEVELVRIAR